MFNSTNLGIGPPPFVLTSKPNPDDVAVWPDGTWCFLCELAEMAHMSDDFTIIPEAQVPDADSPEFEALIARITGPL